MMLDGGEECPEPAPGFEPISTILPLVLTIILQQAETHHDEPSNSEGRGYRWAA